MRKNNHPFELPFFVLLVSIYPAVSLLGDNISEVNPAVVLRPLLFSILFAAALFGVLLVGLRSLYRASFFTTVLLILFFSYGHIINYLSELTGKGSTANHHKLLLTVFFLIFLTAAFFILRAQNGLRGVSKVLNIGALGLLILPVLQIANYSLRSAISSHAPAGQVVSAQASTTTAGQAALPDIYYIILDMYTRDDILQQVYGMDNQPFIDRLSSLGFYVARCSQSNYSQTQLSLSSSLNMNYLQALGNFPEDSRDRTPLDEMIENSAVRKYLEARGYQTVSLSAYTPLKIESADAYISTDPQDLPAVGGGALVNNFEALFIQNSALVLLTELPQMRNLRFVKDVNYPYALHIRQQLFILDALNEIPKRNGPKFVFAHVQIPHPPYVFGSNGEIIEDPPPFPYDPKKPVPESRSKALYADQARYINLRITEIVETILRSSTNPPVIILQGDHGASLDFRMPIFNAYYLPVEHRQALYPRISPVNSFRVILNEIFGKSFELLPDIAYDSSYEKPFLYIPTADQREGCGIEQ